MGTNGDQCVGCGCGCDVFVGLFLLFVRLADMTLGFGVSGNDRFFMIIEWL